MGESAGRVLTVAVIGTGSIGMRHCEVLRQLRDVSVIAVPKRPERVASLSERGYAVATSIREAADRGATLGIIASDTGSHVEDGLSAMQHGLDLLIEKPLSTDAAHARLLNARAEELSRKIFVGYCLHFSESLNRFRELLTSIGRVHAVRIECQSYLPDWRPARSYRDSYSARAGEGGVLRDLIHEIDYAGWIFGWPVSLHGRVRNLGRLGIAADEAADLLWETPDGCDVSIRLDYLSKPARRRMTASGEKGTLHWDGVKNTVVLALAGESEEVLSFTQTRDAMMRAQAQAFLHAQAGGNDSRLATVQEGLMSLAVCDAARRSSESGREEKVQYP